MADEKKVVSLPELPADESYVIVNTEISKLINEAFKVQDDYENESKFQRAFLFSATESYGKAFCSRIINQWDNLVSKASKKQPTKTREQIVTDLLVNRKAKQLHSFATAAKALQAKLK